MSVELQPFPPNTMCDIGTQAALIKWIKWKWIKGWWHGTDFSGRR